MELKDGYIQTEIGVSPVDWDVKSLGEIASFSNGKAHEQCIDEMGYFIVVNSKFISTQGMVAKNSNQCISPLSKGDITMVMSDIPNGKALARCFTIPEDNKYTLNQRICSVRSTSVDNDFLALILNRNKYYLSFDSGTGQTNLKKSEVLKCPLQLPPTKTEQTNIAKAICDADALIQSLIRLITKKHQIKQGAMQTLLNPYENGRLKEGWVVKKLEDIAHVEMGQSPSSQNYNYKGMGLPLVQGNADIKNRKTIIRAYTSEITKKCSFGDIIMSVRAPVGEIAVSSFDACIGRGVCAIKYSNKYIFHYLISIESGWGKLSKGSTFDSVTSTEVKELNIFLPEDTREQTRIATILSDMDADIATLETKLVKIQQIKLGMMQSLLTGHIRLV